MQDLQVLLAIGSAVLGLIVAAFITLGILKQKVGSKKAKEISLAIQQGAMTFLNKEYKIMAIFMIIIGQHLLLKISQ